MSTFGLILVLVSCVTHATWNVLSKRASDVPGLFCWASLFGFLLGVPLLIILWPGGDMPVGVWYCLGASGAAQGVYYVGLRRAYQSGEMSFVYPLARSLPVVLLLMAEVALGVSHGRLGLMGVGLVVLGSAALPLGQRGGLGKNHWRHFRSAAALWAGLTALGTAGYSMSDKFAMEWLNPFGVDAAVWYLVAEFTSSMIVVWLLEYRFHATGTWQTVKSRWLLLLVIGVMIQGTYLLVLLAMQGNKVSYVVACRQFSIVLGAALGLIWLGEREAVAGRIIGSVGITAGLILTALAK